MWEDEYDPTDSKFPCKVDRTAGSLSPSQQLNLINHNLNYNLIPIGRGLRIPDRLDSPRTNSVYSYVELLKIHCMTRTTVIDGTSVRIVAHANHCAPLAGDQFPNFVLLDFVNIGQATRAVAQLNGFEY